MYTFYRYILGIYMLSVPYVKMEIMLDLGFHELINMLSKHENVVTIVNIHKQIDTYIHIMKRELK